MSTRIETRPHDGVGRIVIIAALAGLIGVAMTVLAAAALLLGSDTGSAAVVVKSAPLEPGYVDYGLRHPGGGPVRAHRAGRLMTMACATRWSSSRRRWSPATSTTACGTLSQPQPNPIATESDDYGLRHPVAAAAKPDRDGV